MEPKRDTATITLPNELLGALRAMAHSEKRSLSRQIEMLIEKELEGAAPKRRRPKK